jgi:hypothetical protein
MTVLTAACGQHDESCPWYDLPADECPWHRENSLVRVAYDFTNGSSD